MAAFTIIEWYSLLCEFYPSIWKLNGDKAKKNTLDNIRAGVSQYLQEHLLNPTWFTVD
jgi:hypothetical protein